MFFVTKYCFCLNPHVFSVLSFDHIPVNFIAKSNNKVLKPTSLQLKAVTSPKRSYYEKSLVLFALLFGIWPHESTNQGNAC